MSTSSQKAIHLISVYADGKPFEQVLEDIKPRQPENIPNAPALPGTLSWTENAREERLAFLRKLHGQSLDNLGGLAPTPHADSYKGNIENYIGLTTIPTGLAGPLLINGTLAQGDFYVPMATSEGAPGSQLCPRRKGNAPLRRHHLRLHHRRRSANARLALREPERSGCVHVLPAQQHG